MTISQQSDHRAMARAMLARELWLQGFAEKARSEAEASLEELRGADYRLSLWECLADSGRPCGRAGQGPYEMQLCNANARYARPSRR